MNVPAPVVKEKLFCLRHTKPPKKENLTIESYTVKNITVVGGYAIQILWKDGHNTGLYSWEYLKDLEKGQNDNSPQNYNELL